MSTFSSSLQISPWGVGAVATPQKVGTVDSPQKVDAVDIHHGEWVQGTHLGKLDSLLHLRHIRLCKEQGWGSQHLDSSSQTNYWCQVQLHCRSLSWGRPPLCNSGDSTLQFCTSTAPLWVYHPTPSFFLWALRPLKDEVTSGPLPGVLQHGKWPYFATGTEQTSLSESPLDRRASKVSTNVRFAGEFKIFFYYGVI